MNIPTILEDLIKDFYQGRGANLEEIEQTDLLVAKIKKPFAYRFFQTGFSLFLELLLWIGMVACFAAIIFMEKLYPFSVLSHLTPVQDAAAMTQHDFNLLVWTLRGVLLVLGLAFLWTARLLAKSRRNGKILNDITKDLKAHMEGLLRRRSEIQGLSLKYPVDLAEENDSIVPPDTASLPSEKRKDNEQGHNDVLL